MASASAPNFTEITREEAKNKKCRKHAAHCMIYAKGTYWNENLVLMQMRFDGTFGFIGGFVDNTETWEQALNRELHEEIGFDVTKHELTEENYIFSAYDNPDKFCLHFYAFELTHQEFCDTERQQFSAKHFGTEALGSVRVPLYTLSRNRGFPTFLCNRFIGNAREQLLRGLKVTKLCTEEYLEKSVKEAEKILKS